MYKKNFSAVLSAAAFGLIAVFGLGDSLGGHAFSIIKEAHAKTTDAKTTETVSKAPALPPVSSDPQETTATFSDWVLGCMTLPNKKTTCEISQTLITKDKRVPVAKIAIGGEDVKSIAVVLPVSISFNKAPQIILGGDQPPIDLAFQRCDLRGCFASAQLGSSAFYALRSAEKPVQLSYANFAGQVFIMPVSMRGFAQAFDAFSKKK